MAVATPILDNSSSPLYALHWAASVRNERVYLAYRILTLALFDRAIFVIFLLDKGFSLVQIGVLQGVFFLTNILTEVPAGMVGDWLGRKRSVALGLLAYCVYALGAASSTGWIAFLCWYALLGVALSCVYGSDTALLYDSLAAAGRAGDFNRVQLKANALGIMSGALAVLAGGALQTLSWQAVYLAYFGVNAIALMIWSYAREPVRVALPGQPSRTAVVAELRGYLAKEGRSMALPILGLAVFAACASPFFTFSQMLFRGHGISVQVITYVYFAAQMGIGAAYLLLQARLAVLGFYPVILASTLLMSVLLALVSLNVLALDFLCFMVLMMINPMVAVVANDWFNRRVPSAIRASFLSIVGLCMSLSIALVYFLAGYLTRYLGLHQVMALAAGLSACAFAAFCAARRVADGGTRQC